MIKIKGSQLLIKIFLIVLITATGLQASKALVKEKNVGKGSRQHGSVRSQERVALNDFLLCFLLFIKGKPFQKFKST